MTEALPGAGSISRRVSACGPALATEAIDGYPRPQAAAVDERSAMRADTPVGYRTALGGVLRSTAAAYGYTLTIATTLAALTGRRGTPSTGELFLFVAGGLGAFALLEALMLALPTPRDGEPSAAFPFAGALNILSVPAALGCSIGLSDAIGASSVWLLTPLAATGVYLLVVALQVTAVGSVRSR